MESVVFQEELGGLILSEHPAIPLDRKIFALVGFFSQLSGGF